MSRLAAIAMFVVAAAVTAPAWAQTFPDHPIKVVSGYPPGGPSDTAARLGVSVGTVDNALYDAFGQRIVSTIFTQSNQYHVVLEARPEWQTYVVAAVFLEGISEAREALGHPMIVGGRSFDPAAHPHIVVTVDGMVADEWTIGS